MSGGAFNYFYSGGVEKCLELAKELGVMLDHLDSEEGRRLDPRMKPLVTLLLGHVARAAQEIQDASEVLRGFEWYVSGDSGPDRMMAALDAYEKRPRGE